MPFVFGVLIVVLVVKPTGILGKNIQGESMRWQSMEKKKLKQNNKKQSHYIRNGSCSISDRTGNDRRESAFQPDAGSSGASLCIYYPGSFPDLTVGILV